MMKENSYQKSEIVRKNATLRAMTRLLISLLVGIGSIDGENTSEVIIAGAAGVAVISSVVSAGDVEGRRGN